MNKILLSLLVVTSASFFASCQKDVIRGNGAVGTRTLTLPAFHSVEAHYDIDAAITCGTGQQVNVSGYENLLDILDFTVIDGVLKLKFNTQYNTIRNSNIRAAIQKATIHGSGDIQVSGFDLPGQDFNARIHGSGDVEVGNSHFNKAILDMYGSGEIRAQGLLCTEAIANVHGSGHTYITPATRLQANIFGSGNVYYWGSPQVEIQQSGSGRVVKK